MNNCWAVISKKEDLDLGTGFGTERKKEIMLNYSVEFRATCG
jgi:hypothetical protein